MLVYFSPYFLGLLEGMDYTSYESQANTQRITFAEAEAYSQAFFNMTDGFPLVMYLVGWQGIEQRKKKKRN